MKGQVFRRILVLSRLQSSTSVRFFCLFGFSCGGGEGGSIEYHKSFENLTHKCYCESCRMLGPQIHLALISLTQGRSSLEIWSHLWVLSPGCPQERMREIERSLGEGQRETEKQEKRETGKKDRRKRQRENKMRIGSSRSVQCFLKLETRTTNPGKNVHSTYIFLTRKHLSI